MEASGRSALGRSVAGATMETRPGVAAQVCAVLERTPAKGWAAATRGRAEHPDVAGHPESAGTLRGVRLSVLPLVCAGDAVDGGAGRRTAVLVPGAELRVVEAAGHVSELEQPAAFGAALAAVLGGHRNRSSPRTRPAPGSGGPAVLPG